MSHDEEVGEVVSAINNQCRCLCELLGHHQTSEINFCQSARMFLNFFETSLS